MQIKTTMHFYYLSIRMFKIKNTDKTKNWEVWPGVVVHSVIPATKEAGGSRVGAQAWQLARLSHKLKKLKK
jgi:hypothetical protein